MVYEVNYIDIVSELDLINEMTFSPLIKTVPRKKELLIVTNKKPDIHWSIAESSFNETREDDEVFFLSCFSKSYFFINQNFFNFKKTPKKSTII